MNLLEQLIRDLDAPLARYSILESYYHGTQAMAFLSPEAREAIGQRFGRMATNLPKLAVTALAERLRVVGLRSEFEAWPDWLRCDLDQMSGVAHREALTLGRCPIIVWADPAGHPLVTVESPTQVVTRRDPATRQITAAVKKWETPTSTEATLFEPDQITRFRADTIGAVSGFRTIETIPNPLGVVPVVELVNSDRLLGPASSEIDDLIPLVDALNKTLADMMVGSEFYARPRRWASGVELIEDEDGNPVSPFPETDKLMIAEDPASKFGSLPGSDLAAYESSVRILLGQIQAVAALPAHYVGSLTQQPASADALRAAEASLTARSESRQATFGRAWEQVAKLMIAIRTGADPTRLDVAVQWADASTRSIAQEADAVTKLFTAGLIPAHYALARLGYDEDEIREIRNHRKTEIRDQNAENLLNSLANMAPNERTTNA
ncbi:phage portal protein [Ammonicoccus fulvus]|uniref:Phage portal protein n=1 Tax=Ammonicoccus fulvus TaxID=3138240 RepID=A0ABZ3FR45_9ACTN